MAPMPVDTEAEADADAATIVELLSPFCSLMHPVGIALFGPFIVAASFVWVERQYSIADDGPFVDAVCIPVILFVDVVDAVDASCIGVNGLSVDAFRPIERHAASIGGKTRFSACK